ncbi:MAG: hypothetical protein ABW321_18380, partial [Polyangiales bacterium]
GYISLLFPVRERVLSQEKTLRGLSSDHKRLEQQNHALVEQLQRLDSERPVQPPPAAPVEPTKPARHGATVR